MKKYVLEFFKRGSVSAAGGPVVLAIVYGILGATGVAQILTPTEVCLGILSITLMAFIAGGITMIYTVEALPLISAILLHGVVLYVDYLIMYLMNRWIPRGGIGVFSAIFFAGFALIWVIVYLCIRSKTERLNHKLKS